MRVPVLFFLVPVMVPPTLADVVGLDFPGQLFVTCVIGVGLGWLLLRRSRPDVTAERIGLAGFLVGMLSMSLLPDWLWLAGVAIAVTLLYDVLPRRVGAAAA